MQREWSNTAKVTHRLWLVSVTSADRKRDPELGHLKRATRARPYTRDSSGRIVFPTGALESATSTRWAFTAR